MNDSDIITAIIKREGGDKFTNDPADRGGPTKYGITLATLSAYRGYAVNAGDVEALTEAEAWKIYRKMYLEDTSIIKIPNPELRGIVLDLAVNHPLGEAIGMLQRAIGVPDDGVIGPVTLAAVPYLNPRSVCVKVLAQRARFFGKIVSNDHKRIIALLDEGKHEEAIERIRKGQARFAAGWNNRLADLLEEVA